MVQCAALKTDGTKCKRGAREKSKYCASHKGYRPAGRAKKVLDNLKKAREMKTVRKRATTTKGGKGAIRNRPAAVKVMGSKKQCAALTAAGSPCKRLPREGSKYCTAHKGYRPPRKAAASTAAKKAPAKKPATKASTTRKPVAKKKAGTKK